MTSSKKVKIALGGGCHWCTEAVFESLNGVSDVDQGWATSTGEHSDYSEAVMLSMDASKISLNTLLEVHLLTHSSTSNHSMRGKYRSAVYAGSDKQARHIKSCLAELSNNFDKPLVTKVLLLDKFKSNSQYQNYYYQDPSRLYCQRYISPKLKLILKRFSKQANVNKINSALES